MNYYSFHVGDYAVDTRHLTLLEDLAYRRLIDLYYTREMPIPLDVEEAARRIGMRDHVDEVKTVLGDFFQASDDGYRHKRCDEEIAAYKAKADRAKTANNRRWSDKRYEPALKSDLKSDTTSDLKSDANQIPTNNQEPITNNQEKKEREQRATRLPADWSPTDEQVLFCKLNRPDLKHSEVSVRFRDYWIAQPGAKGRKTDWDATWRNWVRNERSPPKSYQTAADQRQSFADALTGRNRERPTPDLIDLN